MPNSEACPIGRVKACVIGCRGVPLWGVLLGARQLGPRGRLLLADDAFGSALVSHSRCLTMLKVIGSCISCCSPRQMSSERWGEALTRKRQAITPARYDEGTLATNHNAATGERGYHNTSPP